jgi:heme exporter protein C
LFLIMIAYMLARRYGGPGGRKLAAALGLFAAVDVPLVYKSVDIWRTVHPQTTVVPTLDPRMRPAFWASFALITLVWALLLILRMRLEKARAALGDLRMEVEDMLEARG